MEHITAKQLEILILLYRFRFLDRVQIQKLLNHNNHKRTVYWLKDLTQKEIVNRKYSYKLKENTKPAIYSLAKGSRKILFDHPDVDIKLLNRVYREKDRSNRFINHHLFLADFYFYLQEKYPEKVKQFLTKTDLSDHYYLPFHRPDAYIALNHKNTKRYFLEIIDEETPRRTLRYLIDKYISYEASEKWEQETNYSFPTLLLVCPNETLENYLKAYIPKKLEEELDSQITFYISTRNTIKNNEEDVWQEIKLEIIN